MADRNSCVVQKLGLDTFVGCKVGARRLTTLFLRFRIKYGERGAGARFTQLGAPQGSILALNLFQEQKNDKISMFFS